MNYRKLTFAGLMIAGTCAIIALAIVVLVYGVEIDYPGIRWVTLVAMLDTPVFFIGITLAAIGGIRWVTHSRRQREGQS